MSKHPIPKAFKVLPGSIQLSEWNIVVIEVDGDVFERFLGLDNSTNDYRISSAIEQYDPENNIGFTMSGSVYHLIGKPGKLHTKAQAVYNFMSDNKKKNPNEVRLKYPA